MSSNCPYNFADRLDFYEGNVSTAVARSMDAHIVSGCQECARALAWMRSVLPAMQESVISGQLSVSQRALQRAFSIMPSRAPRVSPVQRAVSVARLLLDNRNAGLSFAGARDLSGGPVRLQYEVDDLDIDMMQEPASGGKWNLCGEAISQNDDDISAPDAVVLVTSDSSEIKAELDDCEFTFAPINPGTYALKLVWDDHDILINDLVVGS